MKQIKQNGHKIYIIEPGRTQGGGVGVKTPLELDILRKVHYLRKGD